MSGVARRKADGRVEAPLRGGAMVCSLLLVALSALQSCALVVEAYEVTGSDETKLPLAPVRPDSDIVDACEACTQRECAAEYAACLESARCRALLDCHGRCSDPSCIYRCRMTHPASATFEDLYGCSIGRFRSSEESPEIASRCATDCQTGGNWECVGNYSWDAPEPGDATLSMRVYDALPRADLTPQGAFRHVELAGCLDALTTDGPMGDEECDSFSPVDVYGEVTLTLRRRRRAIVMRGGLTGRDRARFYDIPFARSGPLSLFAFPAITREAVLPAFFAGLTPPVEMRSDLGVAYFVVNDCTGAMAAAEVTTDPRGDRFQFRGWGELDTGAHQRTGGFVNLAPSAGLVVSANHPDTGTLLAQRTVMIAPGWPSVVRLLPLAE